MAMSVSPRETIAVPTMPAGNLALESPPDKEASQGASTMLSTLLPMVGSMAVMVVMAVSQTSNAKALLASGGMVVAMLGMAGVSMYRQIAGHRDKVMALRREYLAYLAQMREQVRMAADLQRRATLWGLPTPDSLVLIAAQGVRLWERAPTDPGLLQVRVGSAEQTLSMNLTMPDLPPLADPDPVCYSAAERFLATHRVVDGLPLAVSLERVAHVELCGDPATTRALARAMLTHLATFVSPELLKVAVLCSPDARAEWEWTKWLPHAWSSEVSDDAGPARMVVSSYAELVRMLGEDIATRPTFTPRTAATEWPHVILVVDDVDLPPTTRLGSLEGTVGVTVLPLLRIWGALTAASTTRLLCRVPAHTTGEAGLDIVMLGRAPMTGAADAMTVAEAEAVARRLTPWTQEEHSDSAAAGLADPKRTADLAELLGVGDVRDFTVAKNWRRRTGHDLLRVPFGVTPQGVPVLLDIKESAQGGMGPHGLIIGATGSGKSEVLRTLVLALALTHSPEQLNFVLVDFKGGATFAGMAELPHVSAMISNLESELTLVDRMADALRGEIARRYELLRKAGNFANVTDYEAARIAGKHQGPALPALFIILDEFSELLTAKPEFIDVFVQIGRVGRSLSVHLLLSSQRLEEGRLRGLDSHLSYRIGLRTFSAAESRSVLGSDAAYSLPPLPGVGLLKAATDQLVQFRACYVAAPPAGRTQDGAEAEDGAARAQSRSAAEIVPFASGIVMTRTPLPRRGGTSESVVRARAVTADGGVKARRLQQVDDAQWQGMTQMDIGVALMSHEGPRAHKIWLPPLETPDTLDGLMPDLAVVPELGLVSASWRARGPLVVPLGTIDVPLEQRRDPLVFDLSGALGNLAVIGGPLTGKSTFLRSLVVSLSLVMTPREVQFYIADLGGGTFLPFEGAAHVAAVVRRDQPSVLGRMIDEIEDIMARREAFFRENRIDSMATYRARRAAGEVDDGRGDVFLIVDGWATLRSDFEALELRVQTIAARGLGLGVHVVAGTGRWMDLRQPIRDVLGAKFELRLGDPTDSTIDRATAALVPERRPGRGLEVGKHHALVALPRIDHQPNPDTLADGVVAALASIDRAWHGAPAPKLQLLPNRIDLSELRAMASGQPGLVLGQEERHLGALVFDPAAEQHLLVFGDARSGKTATLRGLIREIVRTSTPDEAKIFVIDPRRTLLGETPADHLGSYMATRDDVAEIVTGLVEYLKARLPGRDVTPEQLRDRSWWHGSQAWVLIDDYDLVSTSSGNPAAPLQQFLAQGRDVGLHVVLARRSGGISRQLYDPLVQGLIELGTTGVMLSGSPDEGQILSGVRFHRSVPGRAQVVSRDKGLMVAQMAWAAPSL